MHYDITIGLISEINIFEQAEKYNYLTEYLTKKTGRKIGTRIFLQYGDLLDNIKSLKIDGAFLGSFVGVLAHNNHNLEPIARPVNKDGSNTYRGLILVRKDSGIISVKDMQGKTIAFVDKAATAGYISPLAYLKENGIADINEFFKEYYFAGSYDIIADDVLNRRVDIGAIKNTVYDRMSNENPRIKEELIILAESKRVSSNGFFVNNNLDIILKNKLKEILLNMDKDREGINVLEKIGARKFIETSYSDYKVVLDIAGRAGIDINSYNYRIN